MHPTRPVSSREAVTTRLRSAIVRNRSWVRRHLAEVHLAEGLGVSRTLVREALLQLEREGLVTSKPGCGFRPVQPSAEEAAQIYPLIGMLERLAVASSGPPPPQELDRMRRVAARLEAAGRPAARISLDTRLHGLFTHRCPNTWASRLLGLLKTNALRYEWIYMRSVSPDASSSEHREIIAHLERGRVQAAAERVERHWLACLDPMLEAIRRCEEEER